MKICILGTRGIPNNYGGFEQFAEYLSLFLVQRKHQVTVYNSKAHLFQEKKWNGVDIVHCYEPTFLGTLGQFVYDFFCILNTRKSKFDVIIQLGYTSSSVWGWLLPKQSQVLTNMDGLEWKRTKYSSSVKKFLVMAEAWAIKSSDEIVADSLGIKEYLDNKYDIQSKFIAYGAEIFEGQDETKIASYNLKPYNYDLLIARMEPENNIEMILEGVSQAKARRFVVIGSTGNSYGTYLKEKYECSDIIFLGPLYDISVLNNIRFFSNIYFHGHSVGGTNPSLLEAMASHCLIAANNNIFNKSVLGKDAFYFGNSDNVSNLLVHTKKDYSNYIANNAEKIKSSYNHQLIYTQYENLLQEMLAKKNHNKH